MQHDKKSVDSRRCTHQVNKKPVSAKKTGVMGKNSAHPYKVFTLIDEDVSDEK